MDVIALRLGDPRELAYKIWHLDKLEEKYISLKNEIEMVNQLIKNYNDRYRKSEAEKPLRSSASNHSYRLKNRKKLIMAKYLELITSLPPLPQELLPKSFKDGLMFKFR